ncbi:MAG: hypothetical protein OHK0017_09080 [Patescibacteria group bacterium]
MPKEVTLKPKLTPWFVAYIIFSIPGFIVSLLTMALVSVLLLGTLAAIGSADEEVTANQVVYESYPGYAKYTASELVQPSKVLVYEMNGTILSGGDDASASDLRSNIYLSKVLKDFQEIKQDTSVKAVVFKMNTPGGEVAAAEQIGDAINSLMKAKNQKQTVFYWDEIVASGGVYITVKSNNNYIVANQYGQSGSIGVIIRLLDLQGLYDKIGVKYRVYKSSESKDYGAEDRNPTVDENKFIQSQVDDAYNRFIDLVSTGRKIDRSEVVKFANGFVYDNDRSKDLKLLDKLGSIDDAVAQAANNNGLKEGDYVVVKMQAKKDAWEELFGPEAKSNLVQKVLGVDLGSVTTADKLKSSQIYLLDPAYIN